jgi:hypothetical protein
MVPARIANKRTVSEALTDFRWAWDLHGVLTTSVFGDILALADLLADVTLQQDQPDRHIWRLSVSGQDSAKSAYGAAFQGSISFDSYDCIWKSWAPPPPQVFLLPLACGAQSLLDDG